MLLGSRPSPPARSPTAILRRFRCPTAPYLLQLPSHSCFAQNRCVICSCLLHFLTHILQQGNPQAPENNAPSRPGHCIVCHLCFSHLCLAIHRSVLSARPDRSYSCRRHGCSRNFVTRATWIGPSQGAASTTKLPASLRWCAACVFPDTCLQCCPSALACWAAVLSSVMTAAQHARAPDKRLYQKGRVLPPPIRNARARSLMLQHAPGVFWQHMCIIQAQSVDCLLLVI